MNPYRTNAYSAGTVETPTRWYQRRMPAWLGALIILCIASGVQAQTGPLRLNGVKFGGADASCYVATKGAKGDGVTDDTAAIQSCITAVVTAGGGTVYFPVGTYLVSNQGNAFSSYYYALRIASASSAPVTFQGAGDQSILTMAAHNDSNTNTVAFFDFHQSTGRLMVRDMQFKLPSPSTTGQGRAGMTIGNMCGATSCAGSGTVESLQVERCLFTNVAFAIHGEGAKKVTFRDNRVGALGNGAYPTYFVEPINLGSRAGTYEMSVLIENNKITNDATNGDHTIYMLGQFKSVIIKHNEWDGQNHDALKFASWAQVSHETGSILIEDNIDTRSSYIANDGNGNSTWLVMAADSSIGSVRSLIVRNNRVKFAYDFIFSGWAYDLADIDGNTATNLQSYAVQLNADTGVRRGHCQMSGNNFDNSNVSNDGVMTVSIYSAKSAAFFGNRDVNAASVGHFIDADTPNMEWMTAVGNKSTRDASWYFSNRTDNGIYDFGNSWSADQLKIKNIGPTFGQQHSLPAVASDTIALLAAVQAMTNKTLTAPVLGGGLTASGSATNNFGGSTGGFTISTGTFTGTTSSWNVTSSGTATTTAPQFRMSQSDTTVPAFRLIGFALTAATGGAEYTDAWFNLGRTITFSTAGAIATQRTVLFDTPTLAFPSAATVTNAATVAIAGAPALGANASITNRIALWIQNGAANFGEAAVSQATNVNTNVTANGASIVITTQTATTAARTAETGFTVNDNAVLAGSSVNCRISDYSGTAFTNGQPDVSLDTVAAGSFKLHIINRDATNALNGTMKIHCAAL